jgi:hypothetical protein
MVIDKSKFVKKSGSYSIAQTDGVADPILLGTATKYEEALSRSFKALAPADISARYTGVQRVHWSEKYDGEGVLFFYDEAVEAFTFAAPSGRARIGLKALEDAADALKKKGIKKALFRGEIYLPMEKGKPRPGIAGVTHASFSSEKGAADALRLALFDILMISGKDQREDAGTFVDEWNTIAEIFGEDCSQSVHRARGGWCSGGDVEKMLEQVLQEGGEGIVVRDEKERDFSKIKPRLSIDAAIMGYVEGSFDGKIGVRNLLVGLTYPENADTTVYQSLARIGSGLDDKTSVDLLAKLQGLKVAPPVLLNDSEGREVHFVKPVLIVEVEGEDWIYQRHDGRPVRSQAFSWNEKNAEWTYVGVGPCPRLVFPAFSKLREDKTIGAGGARIAQALENATLPPEPVELFEPEMLERQVYRKGKDAVRKFILAKRGGEDTLPYIIIYTDFSAGRKEPLKVSTEYALNEKRARELFDAAVKENVKKGWEKV